MPRPIAYLLQSQFVIFLLVGSVNTLFGYGIFSLFLYWGYHYSIATLFSTILGVFFSFKTLGKIVFNNSDNKLIVRFFMLYACLYVINLVIIKAASYAIANLYICGAIAILISALLSYFCNRKFVFKVNAIA